VAVLATGDELVLLTNSAFTTDRNWASAAAFAGRGGKGSITRPFLVPSYHLHGEAHRAHISAGVILVHIL
jgi:hypothetical protein